MAEGEKVDLVKAVKSVATPVYWVKTIMYGLGIACLLFIGFGVYKAYFKKPVPTQTYEHVDKVVYEANKRKLILFAEPYVGVDTKDKSSVGIRAGCRWEF
jgi:arginine exporter protein ArgO